MAARVAAQAEMAIDAADAVLFVVDATVGATDTDEAVVRVLRRAGKPVVLAANKVDDLRAESDAAGMWSLGLGQPYPVSALHGRGSGDLLDAILDALPEAPEHGFGNEPGGPRRVALLGRPNVGKSSLLNRLAGEDRVVVDSVAGTTVDPVDEVIELGGREWRFVDTAGIRRRVHEASGHEYYASLRTQAALEKAEVAVVLVDSGDVLSEQDTRIIQLVLDSGRALVLAFNKWDLVDEDRRPFLEREIELDLQHVDWAPRVNVSARTGWHVDRLVRALDEALGGWDTRIPTSRLNAFLGQVVAAHPHPVRGGKQPRILFATQAATRPPTFVLFTTGFLEAGYRRFLERRLREEFGFRGHPGPGERAGARAGEGPAAPLSHRGGTMSPVGDALEIVDRLRIPLAEVSGLACLRRSGGALLVAVGDNDASLATADVGADGAVGEWRVVTSDELGARPDAAVRFRQLEAVAVDGAGRAWVVTEGTSLLGGIDLAAGATVGGASLETATLPELDRHWSKRDASRSEGLLLLAQGHLLIAKEKDPAGLVEFGPAGEDPLGVSAATLLPADEAFALLAGEPGGPPPALVALAWWPLPKLGGQGLRRSERSRAGRLVGSLGALRREPADRSAAASPRCGRRGGDRPRRGPAEEGRQARGASPLAGRPHRRRRRSQGRPRQPLGLAGVRRLTARGGGVIALGYSSACPRERVPGCSAAW